MQSVWSYHNVFEKSSKRKLLYSHPIHVLCIEKHETYYCTDKNRNM